MSKNYYDILNISPDASQEEVKEKFRSLALEVHPDINVSSTALQKFVLIKEAYDTLTDPVARKAHDMALGLHLHSDKDSFKDTTHKLRRDKLFAEFSALKEAEDDDVEFESVATVTEEKPSLASLIKDKIVDPLSAYLKIPIGEKQDAKCNDFKNFKNLKDSDVEWKRERKKSFDRIFIFSVTTLESVTGTTRKVVIDKGSQTLQVKIPKNVSHNSILRMKTREEKEVKARVRIEEDTFLKRKNYELTLKLPFTAEELQEDCELSLYTAVAKIKVNIPKNTQSKIRIRNHGLLDPETSERADFFLQATLATGDASRKRSQLCSILMNANK